MKIRFLTILLFFGLALNAQQKSGAEQEISSKACDCISAINDKNLPKNKAIRNCIEKSITDYYSNKKVRENINEIYTKVESALVKGCTSLKSFVFSEDENHEYSKSKNVLAQLAYDDGMDYIGEKDYKNAILKFKKATKLDPKFAYAWDNLGISYKKTKQYNKAIEAYNKSLNIDPKGKMPLLNLAITYSLTNDLKKSEAYYKKYIKIYKNDPEGYYGLGLIQYSGEDYENGLGNLMQSFKLYSAQQSPYRSDAANKISYMYSDLKKKNKLDLFNKVAEKYDLKVQTN